MLPEKYQGSIVSFRNDRMGARVLSLLNTIRIAQDYDLPYHFTWMTHGRASAELQAPTEIFDAGWFDARFVSHDAFRDIDGTALDLATLPLTSTAEIIPQTCAEGGGFMCMGTELVVLPWESAEDVAPRYAAAIDTLEFSAGIKGAMAHVDALLAGSGTAFHIRRGDIIYDPVTSNQMWSNKYIPREFYEVLAKRLVTDPDARILVFSDEPQEITRLTALSDQILTPDSVLPTGLTLAQRDFMEIYAMSRCQQIIGPPGSGFSAAAALIGNRPIRDITTVLDAAGNAEALDLLTERLRARSPLFLSDGDTGQSLPFARDHLNEQGRKAEALDLLKTYADDGFSKLFFFKLLLEQHLICRDTGNYADVIERLKTGPLDPALPARLDLHWSEVSRIAALLAGLEGDRPATQHHAAMALWYGGGNRLAYNTTSLLLARGQLDPAIFALPFDSNLHRPVPVSSDPRPGMENLKREDTEHLRVIPPDLLVRDWHYFMGKTLNRGFATDPVIARALELFNMQFAKNAPPGSVASARGVYATALGQFDEARKQHQIALVENASDPLFLKRMAALLLATDTEDRTARVLLEKAADTGGKQSLFKAELAQCLFQQGERDAAIALMRRCCEAPDVLPEVPFLAARMMRQSKSVTEDTLTCIDQALAAAPHVRRFMMVRANILADLGHQQKAQDALDTIIARFGEGGDVKVLRARLAA